VIEKDQLTIFSSETTVIIHNNGNLIVVFRQNTRQIA
jgi:hypothetical protein